MLLREHKNPNKQGDAGLGRAIGWFAAHGFTVCIPLTDSQHYDLIVDMGSGLRKVQVKTSRRSRNGIYRVELRTKGGAWATVKTLPQDIDLLFVVTDQEMYLIPIVEVSSKTELTLSTKYDQFKLGA